MKKAFIIIELIALCCFSACGRKPVEPESNKSDITDSITTGGITTDSGDSENVESINTDSYNDSEEDSEVSAVNRTIIANALNVDENSRNLRFIQSCLNTIGAGQIQKAELVEENNEKLLDIVAEDNTVFRIYLSSSGSVDAVKNCTTGEWPIQSTR